MSRVRRTSMNLQLDLVEDAREVLGTKTTTETIHRALAEIVRQSRLRQLAQERFEDLPPEALERLRRGRTAE